MEYKILFMSPYEEVDESNDNVDIKVALSSNIVYSGTLFTLSNIRYLLEQSDLLCFHAEDMIIVKDLTYFTINESIKNLVEKNLIESYMSMIGTVKQVFTKANGYHDLKNFSSPLNGFYNLEM